LTAWLADDVVLRPPTYAKPWRGKPAVSRLLDFAAANIEAFAYQRIYWTGASAAFRFTGKVGDIDISGVDFFDFDAEGRIVDIEIAARPPKAVAALGERMGTSVQSDPFFAQS
jgi:hypothetical protein